MNITTKGVLLFTLGINAAWATDGMYMEGYGPIATGSGGAAMATDNGTAAFMNNPATLSLSADNGRLDVALGYIGPKVSTNGQDSHKTMAMPALGYVHRYQDVTFGFGIFAQGGMGTSYSNSSLWAPMHSFGGAPVTAPNLKNESMVGVGRVIFPVSLKVNEAMTIGGSLDYVWSSMNLSMLMDGRRFSDYATSFGGSGRFGNVSGSLLNLLNTPGLGDVNYGYFDFNSGNDYAGAAKADGWGGKIGITYKAAPNLTLGAAYHSRTYLGDLKGGGQVAFGTTGMGVIKVNGNIQVNNFQMPSHYGVGLDWGVTDKTNIMMDYRRILWSSVMRDFRMSFTSTMGNLDMTMKQEWRDQDVLMLGVAHRWDGQLTLRAGVNIANNPVPSTYASPLFPAIETTHLSLGASYAVTPKDSVHAAIVHGFNAHLTNGYGDDINHSQWNGQVMYSRVF